MTTQAHQPEHFAIPIEGEARPTGLSNPAQWRVTMLFVLLLAGVVALLAVLILTGQTPHGIWVAGALAGLALLSEHWNVRLSSNVQVSIAALFRVFAAVVFGPLSAVIVVSVSALSYFRRPYFRWAVYTCSDSITAILSASAAIWIGALATDRFGKVTLATVTAVMVGSALELSFCSMTMRVRRAATATSTASALLPFFGPTALLHAAVVTPLAFAYLYISPWSLAFLLLPAIAAHRLIVMYQRQRGLAADLSEVNIRLERANLSFAAGLVAALDARDRYTAGHSAVVAIHAREVATRIGLSGEDQELAHLAGLLHDIGKIGVPPGILEKPGPLTLQERRLIEEHPVIGERILAKADAYSEIARIVRHHHERLDGNGYPDGLEGEAIPTISQIIAIVDAYNAMTSDRPYRDAMPDAVARTRLRQAAGTQFDVRLVDAFENILDSESKAESNVLASHLRHREAQAKMRRIVEQRAA